MKNTMTEKEIELEKRIDILEKEIQLLKRADKDYSYIITFLTNNEFYNFIIELNKRENLLTGESFKKNLKEYLYNNEKTYAEFKEYLCKKINDKDIQIFIKNHNTLGIYL